MRACAFVHIKIWAPSLQSFCLIKSNLIQFNFLSSDHCMDIFYFPALQIEKGTFKVCKVRKVRYILKSGELQMYSSFIKCALQKSWRLGIVYRTKLLYLHATKTHTIYFPLVKYKYSSQEIKIKILRRLKRQRTN